MSRDCFLSQFWPAYALLNELELDKIPIPTFNQEPSLCAESVMAEFGLFVLFSREVQPVQSRISLSRASCTALYCIVLYCTALYCTVLGTVAAAASPFADRFAVGGTNVALAVHLGFLHALCLTSSIVHHASRWLYALQDAGSTKHLHLIRCRGCRVVGRLGPSHLIVNSILISFHLDSALAFYARLSTLSSTALVSIPLHHNLDCCVPQPTTWPPLHLRRLTLENH